MKLPNDSQRIAIVGRTGSGKTQAGAWHLAQKNFNAKRWIIFDFKRDDLLNEIDGATEIAVGEVPKKPGLYIVHPDGREGNGAEAVEAMLWKIWETGNTGVYIDEGYMIGNRSAGLNALLTQGRSKHIPMIVLSQRPVFLSRFVFSEADFFQIFRLTDSEDEKTVRRYIRSYKDDTQLPIYHSVYHDVAQEDTVVLTPVPDRDEILDLFYDKLTKRRIVI
jgi:hypothetical protein